MNRRMSEQMTLATWLTNFLCSTSMKYFQNKKPQHRKHDGQETSFHSQRPREFKRDICIQDVIDRPCLQTQKLSLLERKRRK